MLGASNRLNKSVPSARPFSDVSQKHAGKYPDTSDP